MKLAARFIDLLLFTSVFTACCATGLCMATEQLINTSVRFISPLHVLVFGSTLLVYNTPRLLKRPYGKARKQQPYRNWFLFFFCMGLVLTVVGLYGLSLGMLLFCGVLGAFAFAYFLPILPFGKKKRLRDFGWIKIAVLACVWTTATAVLPLLYWDKDLLNYPLEVLLRLVFIFSLCVVFDIRDVQTDLGNNISTLPNKIGIGNAYKLVNTALLLFVVLSAAQYLRYPVPGRLMGAMLTALVTSMVTAYLRKRPSDRAYVVLADGVMLLYAVCVTILS